MPIATPSSHTVVWAIVCWCERQRMKISLKIFLGYFALVGLAAWFVLAVFVDEVKPGVRQAMEDTLVDTANVLAALAAPEVSSGNIAQGQFAQALARYQARGAQANISGVQKQSADYRVYITNVQGMVTFDSAHLAVGQDYSQWNDVYLTLRGQYGARSSLAVAGDESSDTIMYIAAPIMQNQTIIGSLTVAKPNRTVLPFIERAQQKIIRWGALLMILSILIGTLFTWRFTKKINLLRDYAVRVAQGAKAVPPSSSNDELTELASAMQIMRNELDGKHYIQDSVQHLTHELKSPISAIQGALELISPSMPAEAQAKFLAHIKTQTNRVQTIIENMLGLAALEHQQQLQHKNNIDLNGLIQTQISHLSQKATNASIHMQFDASASVHISGDAFLLGQAIHNLLENALEFSPMHGVITVQLHDEQNSCQISIRDNGAGIPGYAIDKLFDKFYSLPRPNTQQRSTGLGLNFVQEVAKLHCGSITLQNHALGGAVALLTLPKV